MIIERFNNALPKKIKVLAIVACIKYILPV
jgi:hypothetical protein